MSTLDTPVGALFVQCDPQGALRRVGFADEERSDVRPERAAERVPERVAAQLRAYFAGALTAFDLPLAPVGTAYQRRVWDALGQVRFGETTSYAQLARQLDSVARAVGGANAKNPLAIVVPCHRVVGSDGSLTGYRYGTARKRWLLEHEAKISAPV